MTEENSHSIAMDEDEVDAGPGDSKTKTQNEQQLNNPQNMLLKDAFSDRKNLVRGLCDASLIAANISQLRAVLDSDPDNKFYIPLLTLIGFSLLLHIVFGIIIIQMWRVKRKSESQHWEAMGRAAKQAASQAATQTQAAAKAAIQAATQAASQAATQAAIQAAIQAAAQAATEAATQAAIQAAIQAASQAATQAAIQAAAQAATEAAIQAATQAAIQAASQAETQAAIQAAAQAAATQAATQAAAKTQSNENLIQNIEGSLETIVHDRIPCINKTCTHCRRYETCDDLSILVVFFLVVFNVAISGIGLPTISQNC